MNNIKLDDFEEEIYETAQRFDYPYQESDWSLMESMLDDRERERKVFWYKISGVIVITFLVILFGVCLSDFEDNNDLYAETTSKKVIRENEEKEFAGKTHVNDFGNNKTKLVKRRSSDSGDIAKLKRQVDDSEFDIVSEDDKQKTIQMSVLDHENKNYGSRLEEAVAGKRNDSVKAEHESDKNFVHTTFTKSNSTDNNLSTSASNETKQLLDKKGEMLEKKTTNDRGDLTGKEYQTNEKLDFQSTNFGEELVNDSIVDSLILSQSLNIDSASKKSFDNVQDTISNKSEAKEKKRSTENRFSFFTGIAPDLSFISLTDLSTFQAAISIGTEYRLFPRFTFTTSLAYSNKKYHAGSEDYTPAKKGFWTNGIKPDRIKANCKVLDFNIGARYYYSLNTKSKKKPKIFTEASLSSLLMISEKYDFEYTNPDPTLVQDILVTTGRIFAFSAINIGVGYQKNVKGKFDYQIAPRLQIPLSGIGWGAVRFSTVGVDFRLKYRL